MKAQVADVQCMLEVWGRLYGRTAADVFVVVEQCPDGRYRVEGEVYNNVRAASRRFFDLCQGDFTYCREAA